MMRNEIKQLEENLRGREGVLLWGILYTEENKQNMSKVSSCIIFLWVKTH
jgi:hypothetical protein